MQNISLLVTLSDVETQCSDAFYCGRHGEALRLLKKIEDPRIMKCNNNVTVLHYAAYHGWLDVVKELINDYEFNPDCKDEKGITPLRKAKANGKDNVVQYLKKGEYVYIYVLHL